ncbi:helix-turn-helix domain-containing protein [Clostridium sp. E02]|uniref:helix-turn-helix domain-containing protein n=1 Tax=Clostridium sp. E02 TaxID=2487134 RepID=UPI000F529FCD|nr:helix-turn-helix domain-containing protein [Clostridium sp. E02]
MDCVKVGKLILKLRKEKGMTQKELADMMYISDRTISKWERGIGCPDVSLLHELSRILGVNIEKILAGDLEANDTDRGNMKKIKFYVCPTCGNTLYDIGEAQISCCGRKLVSLIAKNEDSEHELVVDRTDGEMYLTLQHEMTKGHFISFVAYVLDDRVLFIKLYPEQTVQVRFSPMQRGELYFYCTKNGLFKRGKRRES